MGIIAWIVLGAIAGWITNLIMGGKEGVIGTIILYSLSLYLLPASNRAFKDLQFEIRNRFASVLIQDGVFNTINDKLMVYVQGRDDNGDLSSILIYDNRQPGKPVTVFAERGAIANTPDGPRLLMVNGTRQQRDESNGHLSVLTFKQYTLELANFTGAPGTRDRQVDERYTGDLIHGMGPDQDPDWRRAVLVELNMRIGGPLLALTLAALSVACLLTGEFNRRGQTKRILLAVGLAFAIEVVDVALKDLAARAWFAIPLLYGNLLVPLLVWLAAAPRPEGTGKREVADGTPRSGPVDDPDRVTVVSRGSTVWNA